MTSISAVVLTRNNGKTIIECLRPLTKAANEVVVLDTGSTDSTLTQVGSLGIRVIESDWNDDFSEPRNYATSLATGDWIFSVDSDEILFEEDIHLVRQYIERCPSNINLLRVQQMNKICNEIHPYPVTRLFRNHIGIKWEGAVHEQLVVPHGVSAKEELTNIRLYHEGHDPAKVDVNAKLKRNEEMLRKALQKNSNDVSAMVHLGIQLSQAPDPNEGVKLLRKALSKLKRETGNPLIPEIRKAMFNALKVTGDVDGAEEQLRLLTNEFPDYPDGWYLLGSHLYDKMGDILQESANALSRGKDLAQSYRGRSSADPAIANWRSDYLLGAVLKVGGNAPLAKQFFESALHVNPGMEEARQQIEQMMQQARKLLGQE